MTTWASSLTAFLVLSLGYPAESGAEGIDPKKVRTISQGKDVYLPIYMKCPSDNAGTFELISRGRSADERIRMRFRKDRMVSISLALDSKGRGMVTFLEGDLDEEDNEDSREMLKIARKNYREKYEKACSGTLAERRAFKALLRVNRSSLGLE